MKEDYSWAWIEAQGAQTVEVWKACAQTSLPELPRYTLKEQRAREKAYDRSLEEAERAARSAQRSPAERQLARQRITALFPRFATSALGLGAEPVMLLTDGFLPVGAELAQWTRAFDLEMSTEDTVQAARNAWIACGMQALVGLPMKLTPSILAYSLLYPYSDNYLDQPELSVAEKLEFSARFRRRLRGQRLTSRSRRESSVWTMVRMIEDEYPRERYPQVFDSLLAIHQAQELSLAQLGKDGCLTAEEVLRISCAKGGTSVLADACLVQPILTPEENRFSFDWGVLLQLGDDLQDVAEDLQRGSLTLFTLAVREGRPLDGLVQQLLHFSERVAEQMEKLQYGSPALKELMGTSWRLLILMAAADAQPYFSREFLAELEPCSGFRFGFLRKRKEKLTGRQALYTPLFDAFQGDEADEPRTATLPMPIREPWPSMDPKQREFTCESITTGLFYAEDKACAVQLQPVS